MFEIRVDSEVLGECTTFTEAFKIFYTRVLEIFGRRTCLNWLETRNSITYKKSGSRRVMNFYQAFCLAEQIGLVVGKGELQEGAAEPPIEVIERAFATWGTEYTHSE